MSDNNYTITYLAKNYILNIDVNIEDVAWRIDFEDFLIQRSKYIFEKLKLNEYANNIEFSVTFSNDKNIAELNHQYRGKNSPTNCLSFPAQEIIASKLNECKFHNGFAILGDIILSYETVRKESQEQNKSFDDHLSHLLVHSILHLLGYDHEEEKDALVMEALEEEILSFFGIKSPYKNF